MTYRPAATASAYLIFLWVAHASFAADGPADRLPGSRAALLPVIDLSGNEAATARVEHELAIRLDLRLGAPLIRGTEVRDWARRFRIRNLGSETPERLAKLAEGLGVDWLFLATLFEAIDDPLPRVTLSAKVLHKGSDLVPWAGYVSTTGLSEAGLLGVGLVEDLEELEQLCALRLADDLADYLSGEPPRIASGGRARGFVSTELTHQHLERIAILPFDSVVDKDAQRAAALITDLAYVSLHRLGVQPLAPGLIEQAIREVAFSVAGSVDPDVRALLYESRGVQAVLTGTIDVMGFARKGLEPEPIVELGVRLVGARDGRILWTVDEARRGWDNAAPFGFRRIYSPGLLAEHIMGMMAASLVGESGRREDMRP